MAVALYAGSFDPIHLGHVDVVERASRAYDNVVVAIVANPAKASGLFTHQERLRLVTEALAHLESVRVVQFHGLTTDLARREGATVLVRAAHKERGAERSMAAMNQIVAGIPTVFVPAAASTRSISSSLIRQLVRDGYLAAAQDLVPEVVRTALVAPHAV